MTEAIIISGDAALVLFQDHVDQLKRNNLARWELLKSQCTRFCSQCGYPLGPDDPRDTSFRLTQCDVCASSEVSVAQRSYWSELKISASKRRRNMGLE